MSMLLGVAQQLLNATMNSDFDDPSSPSANMTSHSSSPSLPASPSDISGWITFLFSFSALRDWLKLLIIGSVFEALRRFAFSLHDRITRFFFIQAHFDERDESYEWLLSWLSKQPSWTRMRDFEVSTWSWYDNRNAITLEEDESMDKASRKLSYLPSIYMTYNLFYKRRWVQIRRIQAQTGWGGGKEHSLHVSVLSRDPQFILQLLKDARGEFVASQEDKLWIYTSDKDNDWQYAGSRDKRSMNSIVLDPGVKDLLLKDAKDFLGSKLWYKRRGIPFRRGYLLYGPPGSGKTSIIHAVAGELNLNVYVISLSRAGLDDTALSQLINSLPEKCIALMEDVDAAFTHGVNRDGMQPQSTADVATAKKDDAPQPPGANEQSTPSRITLSGLLNALDGVGAQEGRILFATTNRYQALDSALTRPGRMDLHMEFQNASKHQAKELFQEFYLAGEEAEVPSSSSTSLICANDSDLDDKESIDSGYSSASRDVSDEVDLLISQTATSSSSSSSSNNIKGAVHIYRAPSLQRPQLIELSQRFADAIPDREFSMASLQGYLMSYKIEPVKAVVSAKGWVEKEKAAKAAKEDRGKDKKQDEEKKRRSEDVRMLQPLYSIWS